ncbi:MAG: hypothetical protein ACFFD9_10640, partial [Candidatus Thorarchaeota archaeon]
MTSKPQKPLSVLLMILLLAPLVAPIIPAGMVARPAIPEVVNKAVFSQGGLPEEFSPIRRATFVHNDPTSYMDEFAYIAAVPTSVFLHGGSQYISPLISTGGSDAEQWFVEDWAEYLEPDGGATQVVGVGSLPSSIADRIEESFETPMYPRISGSNSTDIAAQLALMDWESSDTAVFALAKDSFTQPSTTSDQVAYTFENSALSPYSTNRAVSFGTITNITFTPPSTAVWLEGAFDWTTQDLHTHELKDPNGNVVDYSVLSQVFFERNPTFVESLVPLRFWYPKTVDGSWTMAVERLFAGSTDMTCEVKYHPGFTRTVTVPSNANWLNVSISWDKIATDLNLALVDPTGRLVQWAPAGSILAGLSTESIAVPYPMPGAWTVL